MASVSVLLLVFTGAVAGDGVGVTAGAVAGGTAGAVGAFAGGGGASTGCGTSFAAGNFCTSGLDVALIGVTTSSSSDFISFSSFAFFFSSAFFLASASFLAICSCCARFAASFSFVDIPEQADKASTIEIIPIKTPCL